MNGQLQVYNTLTRKKEPFKPINEPFVGMYVCGPTVYGYAHLGHAKSYVSFDVIYRYLLHKGYKIRYVQNITDVGHLTDDADEGEDKISRQSKVEKVEPMEIVEKYMAAYLKDMDQLNNLRPNILPRPSCHIPEQIEAVEELIQKGFAYEVNGSVYFDVKKYDQDQNYGELSGRKIEEMMEGAADRELEGQSEKRNPLDFALWKKAEPEHIMQWNSPWGPGYPGWHLECSVMSQKYLGETFDIHGGGMENMFPHHECEIAQAQAATKEPFVKYWLHNNMVTVNGQKMGKSLGNSITCRELFEGDHKLLNRGYSPEIVRFLILQSHYRSTLDFSNEALEAAEKGLHRLGTIMQSLQNLEGGDQDGDFDVEKWEQEAYATMDDDFNTPRLIAKLFEAGPVINSTAEGREKLSREQVAKLKNLYHAFVYEVLGVNFSDEKQDDKLEGVMELLLEVRSEAKQRKDFETADKIRDRLQEMGFNIMDKKEKTEWSV